MDPDRPGTSLEDALVLEPKFQPYLELPQTSHDNSEITAGIRDGSAHVLRCLKVWYDLPSEVLFVAINFVDRFLTKMRVRPKHMACISIASFQLATRQVSNTFAPEETIEVPDPKDLAAISQCKCTLGDLSRMEGIVSSKLSCEPNTLPITSLTFLRIFDSLLSRTAEQAGVEELYVNIISRVRLRLQLEILACDVSCANFRPSLLAWVLLCSQIQLHMTQYPELSVLMELQKICRISNDEFMICQAAVLNVLDRYNGHVQMPYRQRLVWRLSQRTMKLLRPTDKLVLTLPTIDENGQLCLPRSGSLSSDSESWDEWSCLQTLSEEEEPPSTFHCDLS